MFRFYDDELHNLILVANKSVSEIIAYLSNYDYHPPLQYLVNKLSLHVFGLNELWLKMPSIVFMICSIIICSILVYRLTGSYKSGLLCGIISLINPLVFLWGTSLRWYPLWTFLTILSLYLAIILFTSSNRSKRIKSQLLLTFTLILALYTNYQSIFLIITFVLSAFVLDLKEKNNRYIHLKSISPVIIGVIILFIPYLNTFLHHLGTYFQQKQNHSGFTINSPILSSGYFIFSVLFGNSIYPWDLSFIIPICIIIIALLMFLVFARLSFSYQSLDMIKAFVQQEKKKEFFLLILSAGILFLLFLVMSIITGSIQARGYLIIPLLLITLSSICFYHLRKVINRKLLSLIVVIACSFLFIWLIGSYNVISKKSLHKTSLMDPIEEVVDYVQSFTHNLDKTYLIFTYDPVLTYYLINHVSMNNKITIFSPYKDETTALINSFSGSMDNSPIYLSDSTKILFIESYPGSLMPVIGKLENFKQYLFKESIQKEKPGKFGFDADAEIKRKYFPSAGMIDWRYTMYSIIPKNTLDINKLAAFDSLRTY